MSLETFREKCGWEITSSNQPSVVVYGSALWVRGIAYHSLPLSITATLASNTNTVVICELMYGEECTQHTLPSEGVTLPVRQFERRGWIHPSWFVGVE